MAYFTDAEKEHFKEQGYVVKPDVVSMELIEPAVDVLWEEIEADRDDPKTWINAGPRGNLKCGNHPVVRATLSDSPIQDMCEELVGKNTLTVSNHTFAKMVYPEGHDNWTPARKMHLDGYTSEGVVDTFAFAVTVNIIISNRGQGDSRCGRDCTVGPMRILRAIVWSMGWMHFEMRTANI